MNIRNVSLSTVLILFFCFGVLGFVTEAFAQAGEFEGAGAPSQNVLPTNQGSQSVTPSNPGSEQILPTNTGNESSFKLENPLKFNSIEEFLLGIIDIIIIFATPIIVLFIMYAGFLYVTARGDTGQIATAHSALTWAVVGGVIVLGAKILLEVVEGTVGAF